MTTVIDHARRCSGRNWWRKYLALSGCGMRAVTANGSRAMDVGFDFHSGRDATDVATEYGLTETEVFACAAYCAHSDTAPERTLVEWLGYPKGYQPEPEPTPAPEPGTSEFAKAVAAEREKERSAAPRLTTVVDAVSEITSAFSWVALAPNFQNLVDLAVECQRAAEDLELQP